MLTGNIDLGGVEDFGGRDVVFQDLTDVGSDELAANVAVDGAEKVGEEDEAIFEDSNAKDGAPLVIA